MKLNTVGDLFGPVMALEQQVEAAKEHVQQIELDLATAEEAAVQADGAGTGISEQGLAMII